MDIKCKECGSNINLDQSLRDEILNHEIQKHDQVTQTKHQKEIKEMQRVHEESIKSKEVTIEENFKNKVQLLEERNNSLKEHELNLERKNLQLKDEIKDATIAAEKDSRELFKQKEAELEKKNINYCDNP